MTRCRGVSARNRLVLPTWFDPKTLDGLGELTVQTQLTVSLLPAALHTLPDGTTETVSAPNLPRGAWSVTVVSPTGQTWTLPNEIPGFGVTDASFDPLSQAGVLMIE